MVFTIQRDRVVVLGGNEDDLQVAVTSSIVEDATGAVWGQSTVQQSMAGIRHLSPQEQAERFDDVIDEHALHSLPNVIPTNRVNEVADFVGELKPNRPVPPRPK